MRQPKSFHVVKFQSCGASLIKASLYASDPLTTLTSATSACEIVVSQSQSGQDEQGCETYRIDDLLNSAMGSFLLRDRHVVAVSPRTSVVRSEGQVLLVRRRHYRTMATHGIVIQEEIV
jgi:hypothetical protein